MRKAVGSLLVVVLLAVGALGSTFLPVTLPVGEAPPGELPPATPPPGMSLSALPTGEGRGQAMFGYRGGSPFEGRGYAMTPVLVRHPRGDLLIDAGFGRGVKDHIAAQSPLMTSTTRFTAAVPAAELLARGGYPFTRLAGVLLTHAHWDHASGLDALPGVPVWVSEEEHRFIGSASEVTAVIRSIAPATYHDYRFDGPAYLGFARSFDLWGDGAVVVVPAPGHTPGSVIVFVNLPSGRRYAFVGDIAWQTEGIERPAERPWLARRLVDDDAEAVRGLLGKLAALHRRFPSITMMPAHDARAFAALPVFPAKQE